MNKMKRILLLEGHTIEALPVLESLKNQGYFLGVLCDSKLSYGYRSRYPDLKLLKPDMPYDSDDFMDYFLDLISRYSIDILLPLYDPSAEFLSKNKELLLRHAMFIVPDHPIFAEGFEKNQLMALCRRMGFPHPRTHDLYSNNLEEAIDYVDFPSLIKPNITSGGRGMSIVNSMEALRSKLGPTMEVFGDCTLQEYIPFGGKQYKVQLFRNADGKILNTTVVEKIRFYPEKGGSSCCNLSIEAPELVKLTEEVLKELNWEGFADFDLIEDPRDGVIKIMEINPRLPACIKASFNAGVDFAEMYVDYCLGNPIRTYHYRPGNYLRYLGLDLLWFLKSDKRFKTSPNWLKFFGRRVFYQEGSIRDPLPFLFGTWSSVKKLLNPSFRKSKAGMRHQS